MRSLKNVVESCTWWNTSSGKSRKITEKTVWIQNTPTTPNSSRYGKRFCRYCSSSKENESKLVAPCLCIGQSIFYSIGRVRLWEKTLNCSNLNLRYCKIFSLWLLGKVVQIWNHTVYVQTVQYSLCMWHSLWNSGSNSNGYAAKFCKHFDMTKNKYNHES